MKLDPEWRKAWRWFSVQGLALLAAAPVLYEGFPTLQGYLPPGAFHVGMVVLAVLALLGRLVKQG